MADIQNITPEVGQIAGTNSRKEEKSPENWPRPNRHTVDRNSKSSFKTLQPTEDLSPADKQASSLEFAHTMPLVSPAEFVKMEEKDKGVVFWPYARHCKGLGGPMEVHLPGWGVISSRLSLSDIDKREYWERLVDDSKKVEFVNREKGVKWAYESHLERPIPYPEHAKDDYITEDRRNVYGIAWYLADEYGAFELSRRELAKVLGMGRSGPTRCVNYLVSKGLISALDHNGCQAKGADGEYYSHKGRKKRCKKYVLNFDVFADSVVTTTTTTTTIVKGPPEPRPMSEGDKMREWNRKLCEKMNNRA
jgi:hypothetical protein